MRAFSPTVDARQSSCSLSTPMLIKTAWWLYSVNSTTRQAGGTDHVRGHIGEIGRRFSATGHPYEPTHAGVRYFADRASFAIIGKLNEQLQSRSGYLRRIACAKAMASARLMLIAIPSAGSSTSISTKSSSSVMQNLSPTTKPANSSSSDISSPFVP
jgi:hypothetical protein